MQLKKISGVISVIATLLIWVIKFWIRPGYATSGSYHFLLGIAPNLIGSFCIVFVVYWFLGHFFFLFQTMQEVQILLVFFFVLLIGNEFLQLIPFFGRTFDWNDIYFSAIGLGFSYLAFAYLYKKQLTGVQTNQLL